MVRQAHHDRKDADHPELVEGAAQEVHACVPCLRRSGFAQAGETHALRRAGT